MVYHMAPGQGPRELEPLRSWGTFTRYMEVGDDRYASRHVDVFANGYAVRYDRTHWVDDLGMLADMLYRPEAWERWWGPAVPLTADEFERGWAAAESSPTWPLQLATARMDRRGSTPLWLMPRGHVGPAAAPAKSVPPYERPDG